MGIRLCPFIVSFADSCQQEKNSKKNKDVRNMKKPHASKKGIIYRRKDGKWNADILTDGKRKRFSSPYRHDCERWLENVKANGELTTDKEWIVQEIVRRGGTNPKQVPDFPFAFLTDENDLWSCKQGRLRILKLNKGLYYVLNCRHDSISCTLEKIRYCVDNNVSPLALSRARLSVEKGTAELIDCTEYIQRRLRASRQIRISSHADEYVELSERWCHNVLQFYRGNEKASVELQKVLSGLRPYVTDYVRDVIKLRDESKIKYIVDEAISETMLRTLERQSIITSPYNYTLYLCRRLCKAIKDVGGVARLEDGNVRIIGCKKTDAMKQLYNIAI